VSLGFVSSTTNPVLKGHLLEVEFGVPP